MQDKSNKPDWNSLFEQALTQPGVMSKAYSVFYEYSLGNAFLAASQLIDRKFPISPIASFNKWKELGRMVKKGEKAIALVMPVTVKSKSKDEGEDGGVNTESGSNTQAKSSGRTIFILKNNWFALCQTDGAEHAHEVVIPKWDKAKALAALGITEHDFAHMNGNVQGYAIPNEKTLAINPLAALPWKTTFHEMAHCLLHSSEAQMADGEMLQKCIKEAEAESVAYLCCATLELPGLEQSRAYIQNWLNSTEPYLEFRKKSAARVFAAANKILKAGAETAKAGEVGNE
jgi:antirestriction protein ArdC